jgi:hypothetical protein
MIHYGVSKTADVAVARGLAKRMAGTGVTVNSVLPGPTLTEGVAGMLEEDRQKSGKPLEEVAADFVKKYRGSSVLQRAATVEEVANMVTYLVSPLASATSGAAVRVDGGVIDSLSVGAFDEVGFGLGLSVWDRNAVSLECEAVAGVGVGEDGGDVGCDAPGALVYL